MKKFKSLYIGFAFGSLGWVGVTEIYSGLAAMGTYHLIVSIVAFIVYVMTLE